MSKSPLEILNTKSNQPPKGIGTILGNSTNKGSVEPLTGYDFHGTLDTGIKPSSNSIVITGAKPDQSQSIQSYLKKIGRSDMKVYMMPEMNGETNDDISEWKSNTIKSLGVSSYYENEPDIVESLRKSVPNVKIIPVGEATKSDDPENKFLFISAFGEILDIAIRVKDEGHKVLFHVTEQDYKKIGDGIVKKSDNWHDYVGKGWIFVVDGCEHARLQDWLRERGESVVGTNESMSEYENDRQKGQKLFKDAGFKQPESKNFTNIEDCIDFIQENKDRRWVLKQNGNAPKSINHVGKFDGNEDMLFHLEEIKKKWNDQEFGSFDCDLMEFVDGVEVAASGFFNGHDWLRDKNGKVVGFLNFEEKKEHDGGMGETVGETGTTFYGTDEDNSIFRDIMLRPEITKLLKKTGYRGVFDINGSLTDDGFVAFEPTSRFGIPATSYEFMEGIRSSTAELLMSMAKGYDYPVDIVPGWGMCVVITSKPYPVEADMDDAATSVGERLWILKDKEPIDDFTTEQRKHVHLENFYRDEDGNYKVATKNGYLLVITGTGESIQSARKTISDFIKENIYISGMKHRQDIGKRIEDKI